jgi:hypothetical protein
VKLPAGPRHQRRSSIGSARAAGMSRPRRRIRRSAGNKRCPESGSYGDADSASTARALKAGVCPPFMSDVLFAKSALRVLAPSSLTAGSMQKYQPQPPRFRIHANSALWTAPQPRRDTSALGGIRRRSTRGVVTRRAQRRTAPLNEGRYCGTVRGTSGRRGDLQHSVSVARVGAGRHGPPRRLSRSARRQAEVTAGSRSPREAAPGSV